jgi:hypothetical protein
MITTMYLVKRQHGGFDGESAIPPTSNEDLSNGYYVAFILLVKDGTTWVCEDATIGAAVWVQNTEDDGKIKSQIDSLTDLIPRYCDNTFAAGSGWVRSNGISFETGGLINDTNNSFDVFYPGDTINIIGSLRNDGYYDVTAATDSQLTVDGEFPLVGGPEGSISIYALSFPSGLQAVATMMAE